MAPRKTVSQPLAASQELEAGEGEEMARLLNSASRKAKTDTANAAPTNMLASLKQKLTWLGGQPQTPSKDAQSGKQHHQFHNGREGSEGAVADSAAAASSPLISSSRLAVEIPSAKATAPHHILNPPITYTSPSKRKRPVPMPDIYDGPHSPIPSEAEEDSSSRPNKRRRKVKAKAPLVAPKTRDGQVLPVSTRELKNSELRTTDATTPTAQNLAIEDGPSTIFPKRGKGRPRKEKGFLPQSENNEEVAISSTPKSPNGINDIEGITEILMNPSPIKVRRHDAPRQISRSVEDHPPTPLIDSAGNMSNVFEGYSSEQDVSELSDEEQEDEGFATNPPNQLVDVKMLERQIEKAHTGVEALEDVSRSITASRLRHRPVQADQTEETENDEIPARTLLADLYFNIFPELLECIKLVVDVYGNDGFMDNYEVVELSKLVEVYYSLATVACHQPPRLQPKPKELLSLSKNASGKSHSATFQISGPTREIIPAIRILREKLRVEVRTRARAERDARELARAPERQERRKEEEEKREAERRRRVNQRHLEQHNALARQYADPVWGHIMQEKVADLEERAKLERRKKRHAARAKAMQGDDMDEGDNDPFDLNTDLDPFEDDDCERVSVFGKHNTRQKGSHPWSEEQKTMFINFMRVERGDDRYERLAKKMQCSMDEIFAYAKDLQEVMDAKHEVGKFNEACDDWTYDIWVK
ncbi:hypothetical protein G7Y89_g7659 [Cudoniella acicularis]|uniref:Uncharacterized protein n=1 Tax=Cudoniella acicularis TaxID=354080 RepID=A0A8H4RI44_9HELO|nr:hypothetical protein G7Y89_g7659 [Cudoniella acicularis]